MQTIKQEQRRAPPGAKNPWVDNPGFITLTVQESPGDEIRPFAIRCSAVEAVRGYAPREGHATCIYIHDGNIYVEETAEQVCKMLGIK